MKVTADDIAQVLASAPPRQVPAQVMKAAMSGRVSWTVPLFGLLFGGFGLVFVGLFFPWRFWDDWRLAAGSVRDTPGVIVAVTRTNLSINKTRVMEYRFRYTPEDGRPRESRCFTTGESWARRSTVAVRYLTARPEVACIEGARLSEGGAFGLVVLIFPLIGGGVVGWFVADRRLTRRLLREGLVTEVDVVSIDETATKVNNQSVYKIVIAGPGLPGGRPVTVKRVNQPEIDLVLRHAREKQPVFVLYDPRKPTRMLLPEALLDGPA